MASILKVDYTVASSVTGITEAVEELGGKVVNKDVLASPLDSNTHLAVGTNATENSTVLYNLAASVKDDGFVLSIEDKTPNVTAANAANLTQIFKLLVEDKIAILFRKVCNLCIDRCIWKIFEIIKLVFFRS